METKIMTARYFKSTLQAEMRRWYRGTYGVNIYTQVYAEIYGKPMYLNENEIRFLQIKCAKAAKEGNFEEFVKNHIVYRGKTKRGSEPMIWCKNGCFAMPFYNGFFDANDKMKIELFDITQQ